MNTPALPVEPSQIRHAAEQPIPSSSSTGRRRALWPWLALGGPIGFLGALPYLLPLFRGAALAAGQSGKPAPSLVAIVVAQLVQLALLTTFAAWVGDRLGARTGLDAPFVRALVERRPPAPRFIRELPRALLLGAAFSLLILALNHLAAPHLPEALRNESARALGANGTAAALLTGASSAFYGGIVEELLLRWGLLSALVALARVLGSRGAVGFWIANLASAVLFGVGHLPAVHALGIAMSPAVVTYVVLANSLAGLVCGWLFFRRGLEPAMVAHGFGDVCLHALALLFS